MEPEITVELLLKAYMSGIFPMGNPDGIHWYSYDPRGIIDLDDSHIPQRLARKYRQGLFEIRVDTAWKDVLDLCSNRPSTWLTSEVKDMHTKLYLEGWAHSIEAFLNEQLVGGLYGISIGGAFMGESMFSLETDASKVCMVYLIEKLKAKGYVLLDTQDMTPHLKQFGGKLVSRKEYLRRLERAVTLDCCFK